MIVFADYYEEQFINVLCNSMSVRVKDRTPYYVCTDENGDIVQEINSNIYHIIEIKGLTNEVKK